MLGRKWHMGECTQQVSSLQTYKNTPKRGNNLNWFKLNWKIDEKTLICLGTLTKHFGYGQCRWFFDSKFAAHLYIVEALKDMEKDGQKKQQADDGTEKIVQMELRLTLLVKSVERFLMNFRFVLSPKFFTFFY